MPARRRNVSRPCARRCCTTGSPAPAARRSVPAPAQTRQRAHACSPRSVRSTAASPRASIARTRARRSDGAVQRASAAIVASVRVVPPSGSRSRGAPGAAMTGIRASASSGSSSVAGTPASRSSARSAARSPPRRTQPSVSSRRSPARSDHASQPPRASTASAASSGVPTWWRKMRDEPADWPWPGSPWSKQATSTPRPRSASVTARPTIPAPTIATSLSVAGIPRTVRQSRVEH